MELYPRATVRGFSGGLPLPKAPKSCICARTVRAGKLQPAEIRAETTKNGMVIGRIVPLNLGRSPRPRSNFESVLRLLSCSGESDLQQLRRLSYTLPFNLRLNLRLGLLTISGLGSAGL